MVSTQNLPVSEIIKRSEVEEPKKKSREDWRKAKELEEARKAGTAPAAVDEEGKDINPHIPQYIAQAPWYFGSDGPTLKHQRPQPEKQTSFSGKEEWYTRGQRGTVATKYRKGACENCGAVTHVKKDCMERPRKVGAKFTGDDIAPDDLDQPKLNLDYDGKRDRWNGYNPEEHANIVEQYSRIEEAKRQIKAEKLKLDSGTVAVESTSELVRLDLDSKQRITVRNLRIREDTAKYLRNLDINSAYYDPKTRSMRDNPYSIASSNPEELQFAGDNLVRYTGDTQKHAKAQLFAWEAYEKGVDIHLLAEPTKLELLNQEFMKRKVDFKNSLKGDILETYGGAEHLDAPPKELLLAQTEQYVEYSRHGKIIYGAEKSVTRSKYEEDVYLNNHKSVWGSFWKDGQWGYKCCYSFVKNSYCTGEAGKQTFLAVNEQPQDKVDINPEPSTSSQMVTSHTNKEISHEDRPKKRATKKRSSSSQSSSSSSSSSDSSSESSSSESESESDNSEEERKKKLKKVILLSNV
ncbi:mRNA splicing protein [Chamberlinius hualienensis]